MEPVPACGVEATPVKLGNSTPLNMSAVVSVPMQIALLWINPCPAAHNPMVVNADIELVLSEPEPVITTSAPT
ncbi:hypothetical protein GmRootA79_03950 [Acidovorax sp. A79]